MDIMDGALDLIAPPSPSGQYKFLEECGECLYGVSWSSEFRTQVTARRQESAPPAPVGDDYLLGGSQETRAGTCWD